MNNGKQIIPANPGWYAVFVSEDDGKIYTDYYPVAAWEADEEGRLLPMADLDDGWIEVCLTHKRLEYHPFTKPQNEERPA